MGAVLEDDGYWAHGLSEAGAASGASWGLRGWVGAFPKDLGLPGSLQP